MEGFTTAQVSKLTGVNQATLNCWVSSGLLPPSVTDAQRTGTRRIYSFFDVVVLSVANRFRRAGVKLETLRRVVAFLRSLDDSKKRLPQTYLVTDGKAVHSVSGQALLSVLRVSREYHLFFILNLRSLITDLRKAIRLLTSPLATAHESK
jgi:DNA-binding transcriptional MerR regulator